MTIYPIRKEAPDEATLYAKTNKTNKKLDDDDVRRARSSLGHMPGEKWAFDERVTSVFDDMLERSIPQYAVMRDLVARLARVYVQPATDIVDLGCSRGEALVPLMQAFGAANRYVGVDVSAPMLDAARTRFASWPPEVVLIDECDLRHEYPYATASVTMLVLTLMFTPINYRTRIMRRVYEHTVDDGVVILVEKLVGASAQMDTLMTNEYHSLKARNGYTQEEIDRKALSLEGVQVPLTAQWNEDLLTRAGFVEIECFWRWLNFAAWIGFKR